jgi:mycothiol synthase
VGGEPAGEVYVLGVHPAEQGTGLGRALTLAGLRYLRVHELPWVVLYVDGENKAAIKLYESLGFAHIGTDVMYQRDPGPGQATERIPRTSSSSSRVSG